MSRSMILRDSSFQITSLGWQAPELLVIFQKNLGKVDFVNAKGMRHSDLAGGRADEERFKV